MQCQFKGCGKDAECVVSMVLKNDIFFCNDHSFIFCDRLEQKRVLKTPVVIMKLKGANNGE